MTPQTPAPRQPPLGTASPRRWVPIRTLAAHHGPRVIRHLLSLDGRDRVLRFGHLASDQRIASYAAQLDYERDRIFGVFDHRLQLVALVHLAFDAAGGVPGGAAEFGISVLGHMRGRGLGALLFDHAVTQARNRGLRHMLIHMARDNQAMLAIVRRAGAVLSFEGAEALAQLPLPADTLGSQIQELLAHQAAEFDYRVKLQLLRLAA